jgi:hypothetical protein
VSPRIQELLDGGRLVHQSSPDEQVAGLWRDGMGAWAYACSADRPAALRLRAVHDTARMASLALLRASNLRERTKGDHETTFAAAGLLGGDEVSALLGEIQRLRSDRDEQTIASVDDVETLIPIMREMLMRIRDRIIALRPTTADELAPIFDRVGNPSA